MKRLDTKSLLAGLLAGVLLTFTLGADAGGDRGQVGRFQVAGAGEYAVVLDTATGRTWTEHGANIHRSGKNFNDPKLP